MIIELGRKYQATKIIKAFKPPAWFQGSDTKKWFFKVEEIEGDYYYYPKEGKILKKVGAKILCDENNRAASIDLSFTLESIELHKLHSAIAINFKLSTGPGSWEYTTDINSQNAKDKIALIIPIMEYIINRFLTQLRQAKKIKKR